MHHIGPLQRKVLLLLNAGVALGFTFSPKRQLRLMRDVRDEWKKINYRVLRNAITKLYKSNLIDEKHHKDGSITITLSKDGKQQLLRYSLDELKVHRPEKWDKKWRMVIFDIPEPQKKLRNSFRWHLINLGFIELQKSVFIFPYEAKNELDFITEYYNARRFVRYMTIESIDNDLHLRSKFDLN